MLAPFAFALALSAQTPPHEIYTTPKVGDQAIYDVTATKDGRAQSFTSVTELVQFDDDSQRYLERETRKLSGQPDLVSDTWVEATEMLTDEKVDQILLGCADMGGVPTEVTVPAGPFHACMLPVDADDVQPASGWIWIARVRFGIVRRQTTVNGEATTMSLRSFR